MSLWRDTIVPALAPRAAYYYIRLVRLSMRIEFENHEVLERARAAHGQFILAFWHSRFVMMPYVYPDRKIVVLISRHRDSRMLGRVLERFALDVVFGSSTAGGASAFRELLRKVRRGYDVGIAPDGPRGPRRRVKAGVVSAARLSDLPVIPVAFSARPARRLGSWDRTLLPLPFARGLFLCGEPLVVSRDADEAEQARMQAALEVELDRLTDLADTRAGIELEAHRPPVEA